MTVQATKGQQLVEIERELEKCLKEAQHHRGGLITLTSFEGAEGLARIGELEVTEPLAKFLNCCKRARELLEDKKRMSAA